MMMTREQAVTYARTWAGTPYVRGGRIRGAGVDCGTLLAQYLVGIGRCPEPEMDALIAELGFLSNDWFCHAAEEKYEQALQRFAPLKWEGVCAGTPPAEPGDIAMYRVVGSPLFNHGSIVLGWPRALHAFQQGVSECRPALHPLTAHMPMAIFDPWGND